MRFQVVPPPGWRSFLERFSREHRAWLGTMHWVPVAGTATVAQRVALEDVSLGDDASGGFVRLRFLDGTSIRLARPRTVHIEQTDEGAERALEVVTTAGGFLRLAFRATALPVELDGLAPGEVRAVDSA